MSAPARFPGAAPVGLLGDLPPLERRVVECLRVWSAEAGGRGAVARFLGPSHGAGADRLAADFDDFLGATAGNARRPLLAHAPECPCAGGDECVLARYVALAAEGAREEAVLIAALLVRADIALCLTAQAERLGLGLMRGPSLRFVQ